VDLPTYTNIWRIEKRLYKLYDFRLPMPLPINWIAVFAGITIPYVILLIVIGLPFNHSLFWLYVLPPGVLTWLTTRPVIENKRLPELVESQMRYLSEPRTYVRLTPLSEKDRMLLSARVWHSRPDRRPAPEKPATSGAPARRALPAGQPGRAPQPPRTGQPLRPGPVLRPTSVFHPEHAQASLAPAPRPAQVRAGRPRQEPAAPQRLRVKERSSTQGRPRVPGRSGAWLPSALPPARTVPPVTPAEDREERVRFANLFSPAFLPGDPPGQHPQGDDAVHAMPDVAPPAAAPPVSPAPVAAPAPPSPASPAPTPTPPASAPVRGRVGGQGTGPLEVSHDGPRRRREAASANTPGMPSAPVVWPVSSTQTAPPVRTPLASAAPAQASPAQASPAQTQPAQGPLAQTPRAASPKQAAPMPSIPVPPSVPSAGLTPDWPVPARPLRPVPPLESETAAPPLKSRTPVAWTQESRQDAQEPAATVPTGKAAESAAAQETPVVLEASPASATPAAPETPAVLETPKVLETPNAPNTPTVLEAPAVLGIPAVLEAPSAPEAPAVFEAPAVLEAPNVPETPAVLEAPAVLETSAVLETPDAPETPAMPKTSAGTESRPATEPPAESKTRPAEQPGLAVFAPRQPVVQPQPVEPPEVLASRQPVAPPEVLAPPQPVTPPQPVAPRQPVAPPEPAHAVRQVVDPVKRAVPSVERALSDPGRDRNGSWGGTVKIVTGNGAAQGPGARDQEAQDRNRARLPIAEPKRILILGSTSGAGQSVTALMTASMLASLRELPVAAVDLHDGTLARYRAPAAWLEDLLAGKPPQHVSATRPDGLHPAAKPSPARLDVVASHEPLGEGDEIKLAVQLNRHYPLTVLDPGAAGLTRLLKITDQLVVVVPANTDAAGALADTRDWLDNNGHADLAMQSLTVINGVSRRSLPDVEHAESIARGRSRAIVRVPWDDMLPVAATGPATLRPQTRVAYTALAGVLVAGLSAAPVRKK
jgi:TcpE family